MVTRLLLCATLLSTGCMTLARTKGAKPLERGQIEVGYAGPALRSLEDPGLRIPVPQGGVEFRVGTGNDVDVGIQGYGLGLGFDVRYRFFHQRKLHAAVAPGAGFLYFPNILNQADLGGFQVKMPLLLQYDITQWLNVSGGAQVALQSRLNIGLEKAHIWQTDLYTGGGLRVEAHGGIFAIGLSGDVYGVATRNTGVPMWMAGLDLKFRSRTHKQANARAKKRGRDPKWPQEE